jgi:hypothetical protein
VANGFPYHDEFRRQHSDFVPRPLEAGVITEAQAIDVAGLGHMKALYPDIRVAAWFGDFEAGYPLPAPAKSLLGKRRLTPPHTRICIWLVRFWNFERRMVGRGGGTAVFTEQWALVDARTGFVVQRFSSR